MSLFGPGSKKKLNTDNKQSGAATKARSLHQCDEKE